MLANDNICYLHHRERYSQPFHHGFDAHSAKI